MLRTVVKIFDEVGGGDQVVTSVAGADMGVVGTPEEFRDG
jgi:hypothetical protein